jgi:hypothetical protein
MNLEVKTLELDIFEIKTREFDIELGKRLEIQNKIKDDFSK